MIRHNYSSWIEIDLKKFKRNLSLIRSNIKNSFLCFVVKANAYGHGLIEMAKIAEEEKVDYLAVGNFLEGITLRKNKITLPILVFGTFFKDQIKDQIDNDLEMTLSSFYQAKLLKNYCVKYNKKCKIHLKVDTGLGRIGLNPQEAFLLYKYLKKEKCFHLKGIYSHCACAKHLNHPMNFKQMKAFEDFISLVKPDKSVICHIANSGAVCNIKNCFFDMVRIGGLAYGCYDGKMPKKFSEIKPILSLKSRVAFSKIVEKNTSIGYEQDYITKNKTTIVTIPIGYGDGYLRALSNKGYALIRGKKHLISGNICMDQLMIDIKNNKVNITDEVVLIGPKKNKQIDCQSIANLCKTSSYKVTTSLSKRLPRIYI